MTINEMITVLQAAKEGKEVQTRVKNGAMDNDWIAVNRPSWNFSSYDYRIKPEVLRYRVALLRYPDGVTFALTCGTDASCQRLESHYSFVRWLTDWQEVEV